MTSARYINSIVKLSAMLLAWLCAMPASALAAEEADTLPGDVELPSLVINSPGRDIYELEGHATIRVSKNGLDYAVNYGVFDFNSPNFVSRFVAGETDYIVAAYPFSHFVETYRRDGRGMTEYTLNLTPEETSRLVDLLGENLLPENRTYRYNYVKDNCATRPLDMIERATGGKIEFPASPSSHTPSSFRDAMRHFHANYPWYQFGIDLALGGGIDYPISNREMAFAPAYLGEMLPEAVIRNADGSVRPLVKSKTTILDERAEGTPAAPTPWFLTPIFAALLILAATVAVTVRDIRRLKPTKWWDTLIFTVQGIAGIVIAFLVFVSVHEATSPNWLLLWLNPLCLTVPVCIYIKKCKRLVFCYEIVNFVALIILSVVWAFVNQSGNFAFIPLIASDALLSGRYIYIHLCEKKRTTT